MVASPETRSSFVLTAAVAFGLSGCAPAWHGQVQAGAGGIVPAAVQTYTVQPGETLWRVARRYGLTADELARRNGIEDPTRVRAGTVLAVPASSTPPAESSPTSAAPAPAPTPAHPAPPSTPAGLSSAPSAVAPPRATKPEPEGQAELATPSPAHEDVVEARQKGEGSPSYPLRWPVEGKITARFGQKDGASHDGIDLTGPAGTPVRAAAAGRVIFAGRSGGYGNLVILRHEGGLVTVYARTGVNLVRRGQTVTGGELLARLGTAESGESPLHFEVREGVTARNPLKFLPP